MPEQYRVIVSDRARQMLGLHIRFLAGLNKSAARKTQQRILKAIRSLSQMPMRCPFLNEDYLPANKYHKLFVENTYLILYQIKDMTVYVDYIVDCRQEYQWLIR